MTVAEAKAIADRVAAGAEVPDEVLVAAYVADAAEQRLGVNFFLAQAMEERGFRSRRTADLTRAGCKVLAADVLGAPRNVESLTARALPLAVDSRVDNMRVQDWLDAWAARNLGQGGREAVDRVIALLQEERPMTRVLRLSADSVAARASAAAEACSLVRVGQADPPHDVVGQVAVANGCVVVEMADGSCEAVLMDNVAEWEVIDA